METRGPFKGPRAYDPSGLPLHSDNQSIFKERIYLDAADPNILHDEMTTIDNALTHPWKVLKTYKKTNAPDFVQNICGVGNNHVQIGKDSYFLSADGLLMPVKKDQGPPDLRYFNTTRR